MKSVNCNFPLIRISLKTFIQ